jgi:hypothetical protein
VRGRPPRRHRAGEVAYDRCMCRSIHTLYNVEPHASEEEVRAAALQYVRKISGYRKPSRANAAAFERAVDEIAAASWRLLGELETRATPRARDHAYV